MLFINLIPLRAEVNLLYIFFLLNLADTNEESLLFTIILGDITAYNFIVHPPPISLGFSISESYSNS